MKAYSATTSTGNTDTSILFDGKIWKNHEKTTLGRQFATSLGSEESGALISSTSLGHFAGAGRRVAWRPETVVPLTGLARFIKRIGHMFDMFLIFFNCLKD